MRDARRTAFGAILALVLLGSSPLLAQTYPNGLSADSVDPQGDAVALRQIRRRLDDIRADRHRPTVGLVLSGGGAKGAAQVGAIKYIEELGIPIDFVCGTSIGGLVGGLYSLGYDAADLEQLFRTQDWDRMLSDRIPYEYIPYGTKMDRSTYLVNIPFYNPAPAPGAKDEVRYTRGRQRRNLKEALQPRTEVASLGSSLPAGYAYGFNVNNTLASMSVGYQDSISFSRLPIPFVCVAGDIVSSRAKNWASGSLPTAMRSTMSIPGLFDPVRTDGMVLVDGGVRNNFPTDIAKAVGADYIIGIEISDALPDYDQINNIGDIMGQFITMLGKDSFTKNVGRSDVFIKPTLTGYNMMSFNAEAVDTMLARGYAAAVAQRDGLLAIRERTGRRTGAPAARAVDLSETPVRLASIEYEGVSDATARRLSRLTGLAVEEPLDRARIEDAMCRLQATGAFESVTFSLYGSGEPFRLVFHCTPAPIHNVALGLRADTEEGAALLFNIGLGTNRLSGPKADLTARIGTNLKGRLHLALDTRDWPTLNFSASIANYRGHLGHSDDALKYDVAYWTHREDFYISGVDWTKLDFQAGIGHKAYHLNPQTVFARQMQADGMALDAQFVGTYLQGILHTLDHRYFPTRGVSLSLRADYDFLQPGNAAFTPILSGDLDFQAAVPLGRDWAFLPEVHLRGTSHFGERVVDGLTHTNFVGGTLPGRYTEDQVPFFGINHVIATDDYLVDTTLGLRWRAVDKLFVTALAGALLYDDTIGALVRHPLPRIWAVGAEAGYDTFAGPIRFNVHWSNTLGWGAHLSFGYDF